MVAAPFNGTLIMKGMTTGRSKYFELTYDDVSANFVTFPDGSDFLQLDPTENWMIVDIINVVGGTDTTKFDIFKNGLSTAILSVHKSNLNTSNNRQFQANPAPFSAGAVLKFQQG